MTTQDIITLASAGFTSKQIAMVMELEHVPQGAAPEAPTAATAAPVMLPSYNTITPIPPAAPAVQSTAQPDETAPNWDSLIAELKGLRQDVIRSNIAGAAQPAAPEMTLESIMADIIAPPEKEGGKT